MLVDQDAAAVRGQLALLHLLQRRLPELVIVPAHDRRAMAGLPPLTADSGLSGASAESAGAVAEPPRHAPKAP